MVIRSMLLRLSRWDRMIAAVEGMNVKVGSKTTWALFATFTYKTQLDSN